MRFLFLLAFFLTFTLTANAQDFESMTDEVMQERLFQMGYYQHEFEGVTFMLDGIFEQLTDRQDSDEIIGAVINAYDEREMQEVIRNSIRRMFNRQHAISTLEHHSNTVYSDLNRRIFGLTLILDDEEKEEDFRQYLENLDQKEDYAIRIDETERILQASRLLQNNLQRIEDILSTVVFGLNVSLDEHERLSDRDVNNLVITLRQNFRELLNNVLPFVLLYSTRDIPVEILIKHAEFLESESGRWYIRSKNAATLDSFGELAQRASESIAAWALERAEE